MREQRGEEIRVDQRGDQASEHARRFADLLSTARRRAGLTQQALARATALPRSLISELEHARTPVRLAHVRPLAGRLAATMAEYRAMLACAHPAAGTRRWGPLTGISTALENEVLAHLQAGLSDGETAAAVRLSPAQVRILRRYRRQPALPPGERTRRLFADLDRQIVAAYQAGLPYAAIVASFDVPRSTLYEILEQHRVPRRRQTGGRRKPMSSVVPGARVGPADPRG
jgi:transcriptional regulator with XRE-family HTH domain